MLDIKNMDLRTYLFINRLTSKSFAESIDYSGSQVAAIAQGRRKPGRKLARAIERATNSQVTAEQLLKDKPKPMSGATDQSG